MNDKQEAIVQESHEILFNWLDSCTRSNKVSRNTISVGIVVLHHLLQNPIVTRAEVISGGGEVKGARSGLGNILQLYGVPMGYLKEVTTRQGHQDGQRLFEQYGWGERFAHLPMDERRNLLLELISELTNRAHQRMMRQNLKLDIDRRQAPAIWINLIVENARQRSGGVVEQHLVGAKLERRFSEIDVPNYPAHAADVQTARTGDFVIANMVYHVTATPGRVVIQKCAANLRANLHPILLVPKAQEYRASALAQDEGIDKALTIISIEDFVSLNIIELAIEESKEFFAVLQEIVQVYNTRLAAVETDLSLQIEVR